MNFYRSPLMTPGRKPTKEEAVQIFLTDLVAMIEDKKFGPKVKETNWYKELDLERFYAESKSRMARGLPLKLPKTEKWEHICKKFGVVFLGVESDEETPEVSPVKKMSWMKQAQYTNIEMPWIERERELKAKKDKEKKKNKATVVKTKKEEGSEN